MKREKLSILGIGPIYVGIIIIITNNLYFLFTIPFYWGLLTVLIKKTEEVWLKEIFGEEYIAYCKRVNRCIPWLSRHTK